jgi:hypothetical protein
MNYVEAYNLEIGLLINFGSKSLQLKRVHNNKILNRHTKGLQDYSDSTSIKKSGDHEYQAKSRVQTKEGVEMLESSIKRYNKILLPQR